jgi:hypothetical protein
MISVMANPIAIGATVLEYDAINVTVVALVVTIYESVYCLPTVSNVPSMRVLRTKPSKMIDKAEKGIDTMAKAVAISPKAPFEPP